MLIDCILDRKDGEEYDYCNGHYNDIAELLDNGTEKQIKQALCDYIKSEGYSLEICDYINSVNWLND